MKYRASNKNGIELTNGSTVKTVENKLRKMGYTDARLVEEKVFIVEVANGAYYIVKSF